MNDSMTTHGVRSTTRLKEIFLRQGSPVELLFPTTTREARMLDALGFETFYVGAGAVIGPIVGRPDNGTITLTESVQVSKWFVDAVDAPVWTDTDACFGGIFQVERAVQDYIGVGVAAITIEDQPFLGKRFGGMVGKEVLPLDEAVAKIRVAADTRDSLDPDFQIVARCDALTAVNAGTPEATIERLLAYKEAGADVLYLEGPRSLEEVQMFRDVLPGPMTCTPFNLPREMTRAEAIDLGQCVVWYLQASRITKNWHWWFYQSVREGGAEAMKDFDDAIPSAGKELGDLSNSSAMAKIRQFEEKYLPPTQLTKYDGLEVDAAGNASTTVSSTAGMVEH